MVDLGFAPALRCSIAIAGERPSMKSTSGFSRRSRNCLAYAERLSTYRRCPSAYKVSKASEDLPDPLNPVMTTSFSRGISTWRFFRLCWRAPLILITCAGILTRNVEPISQAQAHLFSTEFRPFMSESAHDLTPADFVELQKKFSEIKHSINNALA